MNTTRRELLCYGALLFTGVAGCSENRGSDKPESQPQSALVYDPRQYITPEVGQFMQDINKDPIFRAASLTIYNGRGYGHASLIIRNGRLELYTVAHVPRMLGIDPRTNQVLPLFLHVPGIDFYQIDARGFQYFQRSDDDPPSFNLLTGVLEQRVRQEVEKGTIRPLTLIGGGPRVGEYVAVAWADTGRYTVYAGSSRTNDYDINLVYQNAGVICSGRSGGSVLRIVENGRILPEVYGVVSSGRVPGRPDPLGQVKGACFETVNMKIN